MGLLSVCVWVAHGGVILGTVRWLLAPSCMVLVLPRVTATVNLAALLHYAALAGEPAHHGLSFLKPEAKVTSPPGRHGCQVLCPAE